MTDLLDLIKGTPAHRLMAKKAIVAFDRSQRFVVKGGKEGSRGGNVIGHTSSGRPIYAPKGDPKHGAAGGPGNQHIGHVHASQASDTKHDEKAWTRKEHLDAAHAHETAENKHARAGDSAERHTPERRQSSAMEHAHNGAASFHRNQAALKRKAVLDAGRAAKRAEAARAEDKEQAKVNAEVAYREKRKRILAEARASGRLASKSVDDNPDLVKGGGWMPIPGGKHGGLRKRSNKHGGWDYWYKDQIEYKAGKRKGEHDVSHTGDRTEDGHKMHIGPEAPTAAITHHEARSREHFDALADSDTGKKAVKDWSHADHENAHMADSHASMSLAIAAGERAKEHFAAGDKGKHSEEAAKRDKHFAAAESSRKKGTAANDRQWDDYHDEQARVHKLDKKVVSHHRSSGGQEVKVVAHVSKDGEAQGHSVEQSWDAAKPTNRGYAGGAHSDPTISGHGTLESAKDHAEQIMGLRHTWTKKSLSVDDNLVKGGEGSRGGHVIGHTSSGKPIYASHAGNFKAHTKGWSSDDHIDAANHHEALSGKHSDASGEPEDDGHDEHWHAGNYHDALSEAHTAAISHADGDDPDESNRPEHHLHAADHTSDPYSRDYIETRPLDKKHVDHAVKMGAKLASKSVDDTPDLLKAVELYDRIAGSI